MHVQLRPNTGAIFAMSLQNLGFSVCHANPTNSTKGCVIEMSPTLGCLRKLNLKFLRLTVAGFGFLLQRAEGLAWPIGQSCSCESERITMLLQTLQGLDLRQAIAELDFPHVLRCSRALAALAKSNLHEAAFAASSGGLPTEVSQ